MPFLRFDDGPLAILTLDHGDLNLFDQELFDSLEHCVRELSDAPPRGLLIEARGRVVSGGVDVHMFEGMAPASAAELWRSLLETIGALEELPCPTVFAAHALCLTAAFEVALASDLLVAAESARFGLVERVVGLTPSMGGPQRLTERAGPARARHLIYSGDLVDAATLQDWGVVTSVWPDHQFADEARKLAARLAAGPTLANAATKRLVRVAARDGVAAADALVPETSSALFATEDLRAAVKSFLTDGPGKASFRGE